MRRFSLLALAAALVAALIEWETVQIAEEVAADALALDLMRAASFDVRVVSGFLERLAIEHPWEIFLLRWERSPSHSFVPARLVAIDRALR